MISIYVWIGNNVIILVVNNSDYDVIGANSVVNRNVKIFEITEGNPIKHIKYNTDHFKFQKQS